MILSCQTTGFKPGDYCVFQLVSITHEIYKSFDKSHEVRGAFLDISKAFDKIWYDVITFKLTQNGISGNLTQRVVLNGHVSTWTIVTVGVPQGSILGPLMFLIYKNDLSEGLSTNAKLFADNTSLFSVIHNSQTSANDLNKDLEMVHS